MPPRTTPGPSPAPTHATPAATTRVGVGIDTSRHGHSAVFLTPDLQPAAGPFFSSGFPPTASAPHQPSTPWTLIDTAASAGGASLNVGTHSSCCWCRQYFLSS